MMEREVVRALEGRLSPHFSKKGPGRVHYQGEGHKKVPPAAKGHAVDCELNNHPATNPTTCNCFVERGNREFIDLDSFGKVRDNSMRAHIGPFGEVQ